MAMDSWAEKTTLQAACTPTVISEDNKDITITLGPSGSTSPTTLKIASLGRPFFLGCLYDFQHDSIVQTSSAFSGEMLHPTTPESNLTVYERMTSNGLADVSISISSSNGDFEWDSPFSHRRTTIRPKQLQMSQQHANQFKLQIDKLSFDQGPVTSKWSHMQLDNHIEVSIASGIIDTNKLDGASRYLQDETDITQAVRTVRLRLLGQKEEMPDEIKLDTTAVQATHFVSSIQYGAEAYIIFQHHLSEGQNKEKVEEEMDSDLQVFINALMDNTDPDLPSCWKGTVYADLHDQPRNCTLLEALRFVRNLIESIECNPVRALPTTVWLQPLPVSTLGHQLDDQVLNNLRIFLDGIATIKASARTLLKKENALDLFLYLRTSFRRLVDYIERLSHHVRTSLRLILPAIRTREKEPNTLSDMLNALITTGPFTPAKLNQWFKAKVGELRALKAIKNMAEKKKIPVIRTEEHLQELLLDTKFKWIVALALPGQSQHEADTFLRQMKIEWVARDESPTLAEASQPEPTESIGNDLMKMARQMFQQADRRVENVAFVLAIDVISCPEPRYRPFITLFQDGQVTNNNFDAYPDEFDHLIYSASSLQPAIDFNQNKNSDDVRLELLQQRIQVLEENEQIATNSAEKESKIDDVLELIESLEQRLKGLEDRCADFQAESEKQFAYNEEMCRTLFNRVEAQNQDLLNVQDPNSAVVENYSSIVDLLQLKIKESKDIIERMISDNIEQLRSQLVPQQTEVEALKSQVTENNNTIQKQMVKQEFRVREFRKVFAEFAANNKAAIPIFCVSVATSMDAGKYVTFMREELNRRPSEDGFGHFDKYTGMMTVTKPGVYLFQFNGLAQGTLHSSTTDIHLGVNGKVQAVAWASGFQMLTLTTLLNLKEGDKVGMFISKGSLYEGQHRSGVGHTRFSCIILSY